MRVNVFLLAVLFCGVLSVSAASDIPLVQGQSSPSTPSNEPRSIIPEVTASIDGVTITLILNLPSDCEYSVYACSSDTVICSGRFATGSATAFDLPVSILSGTYQLCVYAYGCWWTGTFVY